MSEIRSVTVRELREHLAQFDDDEEVLGYDFDGEVMIIESLGFAGCASAPNGPGSIPAIHLAYPGEVEEDEDEVSERPALRLVRGDGEAKEQETQPTAPADGAQDRSLGVAPSGSRSVDSGDA